MSVE
jgi:hypothetical protein